MVTVGFHVISSYNIPDLSSPVLKPTLDLSYFGRKHPGTSLVLLVGCFLQLSFKRLASEPIVAQLV